MRADEIVNRKDATMNIQTAIIKPSATLLLLVSSHFAGCDTNESNTDDTTNDSEIGVCANASSNLVLDEAHDYSFSSDVTIKIYEMQEYPNVPYFDWSGLTGDIQGREVDLDDIGHAEIIVWNLNNYDAFEEWLNTDQLDMGKLESMVNLEPALLAQGGAYLSDFTSGGMDVDAEQYFQVEGQFPSDKYIFVLVVGRGNVTGSDAVSSAFLKPVRDTAAATDMSLEDTSVSFTYDAIFNETPYGAKKNADTIVDWTYMLGSKNALDQEFTPNQAGRIMLTFYQGKKLEQLQDQFLKLETVADRKYSYDAPDPTPISLSTLVDENGAEFSDFGSDDGTWLLSLWCTSNCNNPAPKYMASVVPCP
jgi:hypothetical protein